MLKNLELWLGIKRKRNDIFEVEFLMQKLK